MSFSQIANFNMLLTPALIQTMRGIFEVTIVQSLTYMAIIARLDGFKRKITYIYIYQTLHMRNQEN